ncbi:MAG: hypothetical protein Q7R78_03165, partial [bacterium]|nr:hypothetical protein [bacterium]
EKHVIGMEQSISRQQQYSLVFDHIISRYLFERIVRVFVEFYPRYSFSDVAGQIVKRFRSIQDNYQSIFPTTVYRFSKQSITDNEVVLTDTGEKPLFR